MLPVIDDNGGDPLTAHDNDDVDDVDDDLTVPVEQGCGGNRNPPVFANIASPCVNRSVTCTI